MLTKILIWFFSELCPKTPNSKAIFFFLPVQHALLISFIHFKFLSSSISLFTINYLYVYLHLVISLSFWSISISYSSFILSSLLSISLSFPLFRFHPPFQVNRIPNFAILVCSCFHVRLRVKSFNVGKVQSPTSMYCEADFYSSHFWGSEKVA